MAGHGNRHLSSQLLGEAQTGESQPRHKARSYLKTSQSKKDWRNGQVVEHLPSKNKALSSTPSTAKTTTAAITTITAE
jgi:hypothetical protein